ncbi:hypothetical protein ILUMI_05855 [Ignelater luminosus]|uniref:Peptidase S1 domain-containing protein n=1 Tax=Ignelater luminosus TaxID=2038154 RepID=A0A8K0DB62_IGNLU|nr:hypothetical protein ILUMI_05855 [Ignelater luminosus]
MMFKTVFIFVVTCIICDADQSEMLPRVRKGHTTTIDQYPFVATIIVKTSGKWSPFCLGTIITPFKVLTSATCIKSFTLTTAEIGDIIVRANTEFWDCSCGRARDHTLAGYVIHERYEVYIIREIDGMILRENDVGIISVIERFEGVFEQPLSYKLSHLYWKSRQYETRSLGWSNLTRGQKMKISKQLKVGTTVWFTWERCNQIYGDLLKKHRLDKIFCSSKPRDYDVGPCKHDVGGPILGVVDLQFKYLIGMESSSHFCWEKRPVLFTNITYYVQWIDAKVEGDPDPSNWFN